MNSNTFRGPFLTHPDLGLPYLKVAGATIGCEMVGCRGNRLVYRWTVVLPQGNEYRGTDLESPGLRPTDAENDQEAFGTLLCFLSACGEGYRYQERYGRKNESATLFPVPVARWASENVDELDMMRMELEESEECYLATEVD